MHRCTQNDNDGMQRSFVLHVMLRLNIMLILLIVLLGNIIYCTCLVDNNCKCSIKNS